MRGSRAYIEHGGVVELAVLGIVKTVIAHFVGLYLAGLRIETTCFIAVPGKWPRTALAGAMRKERFAA